MVTLMVKVPTLLEHLSLPLGFNEVYVTRHLVLCVRFCGSLFVPFFLYAIVLSVLLRFTVSDYLPLVSSNSSLTIYQINFDPKEQE